MKNRILYTFLSLIFVMSSLYSQRPQINLGTPKEKLESKVYHNPFINQLQIGEKFTIKVESIGCFNSEKKSIIISRNENGYMADFGEQKISLTKQDILDFSGFEKELVNIGKGYCSSSDNYTLTYQDQELKVIDSTCSWNGIYRIMKKFDLQN